MFERPERCPNRECGNHLNPQDGFLAKRGIYKTLDGRSVQRYRCSGCGRTFSNKTLSEERRQRADINDMLFKLVCSGTTIRRSAMVLGVAINTVRRRMSWLAMRSREEHAKAHAAGLMKTEHALFDEMQTFLHTRSQPLTIALVVRKKTGQILSAKAARISARGTLAAVGRARGWTKDHAKFARGRALKEAGKSIHPFGTVTCDGFGSYPLEIRRYLGAGVTVDVHVSRKGEGFDHLYRLNHVCAKIRADIACMARDTWTTTKSIRHLQERLDIYVAWNNGYCIY
ncbi:MAG: transposase [Burkholderiales bacterium]